MLFLWGKIRIEKMVHKTPNDKWGAWTLPIWYSYPQLPGKVQVTKTHITTTMQKSRPVKVKNKKQKYSQKADQKIDLFNS